MQPLIILLFLSSISSFLCADQNTYGIPTIYAPWRDAYFTAFSKDQLSSDCPFCPQIAEPDSSVYFVLKRAKYNIIMLNAFPYSRGHLLIVPYEHTGNLDALSPEARAEIMELANECCIILKKAVDCTGFNIGFNLGPHSGASVKDHLHFQIVPRFPECMAFMHTIGKTHVICFDLEKLYQKLLPWF
jgi:ATP adenylyltransferase